MARTKIAKQVPKKKQQTSQGDKEKDEQGKAQEEMEYKTDWSTSTAKNQLKQDILDGRIDGWSLRDIYFDPEWHHLYQLYKRENFTNNPRTLRESLEKALAEAARDKIAFKNYLSSHPINRDKTRWHQSDAQKLLRHMIRIGVTDGEKPSDVRNSDTLFQAWTLKQFRDHFDHEKVRHWKKMHDKEYAKRVQFLKAQITV